MANNLYGRDDKHYFLDIDMAILGAPADEYNSHAKQVREEYSFLPDDVYKNLRLKVSSSMFRGNFSKKCKLRVHLVICENSLLKFF